MPDDYDCDYCDNCEMDYYQLIERLINDIQHLESKTVRLRYLLSRFLPECDGETLRCEIFSDLAGNYYEQPAYQRHISKYYGGRDPMDDDNYCKLLLRISRGEEMVDY
jgi:hypothetical protein